MSDARSEILQRVLRAALPGAAADPRSAWALIPRDYRRRGVLSPAARVDLFRERLHDYDAATHLCGVHEIASTVSGILQHRALSRLTVPPDLPPEWLPGGFTFVPDRHLTYDEIDGCEGVVTACSVAIALTGTIVLQEGSAAQGRRALTLIPDYHLCLVRVDQIVETVPEAFAFLNPSRALPITTISGPSATADIEMTRVRGIHGPRTLEVLIVNEGNG